MQWLNLVKLGKVSAEIVYPKSYSIFIAISLAPKKSKPYSAKLLFLLTTLLFELYHFCNCPEVVLTTYNSISS